MIDFDGPYLDGWTLQAARAAPDTVRIVAFGRKAGAETYVGINLTRDEARAFARGILAETGDSFERSFSTERKP